MAKSIFEIAESGIAEVTHNGAECNIDMPEWWTDLATVALEGTDEEMMDYINDIGCIALRAVLQTGAAKLLIELRAVARPADRTAKQGGGKRELMELYDDKMPQDRVDAYELKPMKRPGSGKVKALTIEEQFDLLSPEKKMEMLKKLGM